MLHETSKQIGSPVVIRDNIAGETCVGLIEKATPIPGYGTMYTVDVLLHGPITVLEADDGVLFTTTDWFGQQPQTVEEIPDYCWVSITNPCYAIMLNGLPRQPHYAIGGDTYV